MERNNAHTITPVVVSSEATTPLCTHSQSLPALQWYPLRVYYPGPKKILRVKDFFDRQGIENFLPMQWTVTSNEKGRSHRKLVPAVFNLIVIKAYNYQLNDLKKQHASELYNVQYRRDQLRDGTWSAPITVSERDMRRFMDVVIDNEDSLTYIDPEVLKGKKGRNVLIVAGQFKGAEGTLMRIDNNRHVVVQLQGLCSVKLNHVPIANIRFVS